MKLLKTIILIVISCNLTACTNQKIVDDIKIIQTIGYDLEGNNVKSTVLYPSFEKKGETNVQLLDTKSNSYYDIMPRLNTKTNTPIEYGQLGMVLFGKSFSEKGIEAVIHSICRDAQVGSRVQLGVAEKEAAEILQMSMKFHVPYYIAGMINQNIDNGNLPEVNLQTFLFDFYGEGQDPFLPYMITERGKIKIGGLVLFKHDKYKTNISIKKAFILKMLIENSKNGSYLLPLKEPRNQNEDYILMNSVNSRTTYKVNEIYPVPSIAISLKLEAQVKDVPDHIDLLREEQLRKLEKEMEAHFVQEIQDFITLCKNNMVDPIGFGDLLRSKSKVWSEQSFESIYPKLKTSVSVHIEIIQTGVGE
ncbi:Ger(x)C family spore germination protein [Paenibacillus prosopidis]|uniref:Ger(X)C family germination protein n=1 Tax=Paenibacillus prosopidis TaxID=630520 RepID=A0A368W9K1_9BACL|nr:Ger(x)C family spore germination protein [Paenibacillus prosopidis]RCW49462.1 Ger(x)C family germination protein [Paenibacillus prosopidis]